MILKKATGPIEPHCVLCYGGVLNHATVHLEDSGVDCGAVCKSCLAAGLNAMIERASNRLATLQDKAEVAANVLAYLQTLDRLPVTPELLDATCEDWGSPRILPLGYFPGESDE